MKLQLIQKLILLFSKTATSLLFANSSFKMSLFITRIKMFIPTLLLLASADPFLDSKYVDLKFEDTKNTLLANPEYLTFVILFKDDGPFTDKLESLVNLVA